MGLDRWNKLTLDLQTWSIMHSMLNYILTRKHSSPVPGSSAEAHEMENLVLFHFLQFSAFCGLLPCAVGITDLHCGDLPSKFAWIWESSANEETSSQQQL